MTGQTNLDTSPYSLSRDINLVGTDPDPDPYSVPGTANPRGVVGHSELSPSDHGNYEDVRLSQMTEITAPDISPYTVSRDVNPRDEVPIISPYSVSGDINPRGEVPDVVPESRHGPSDVTVTPGNSRDKYAMVRKSQAELKVAENTVYHTFQGE